MEAGIVLKSGGSASTRFCERNQAEQCEKAQEPQEENHSLFIDANGATLNLVKGE
jgi:hypothetical protein